MLVTAADKRPNNAADCNGHTSTIHIITYISRHSSNARALQPRQI
jgi:hypothetical protein